MSQPWEEVLGSPDLAGQVLEAARRDYGGGLEHRQRSGGSDEQATQAARGLCLASAACRQAVLGAVERAAAPVAWALEHTAALGAMTALASLRLTRRVDDRGVDPAQLPPLPRVTSLECSLRLGAEAAPAWPLLSGLQQLILAAGAGGGLPPALLQLPHLTSLRARASSWDALRPIEQLTRLRALEVTCPGEGEIGVRLVHLSGLTSLSLHCGTKHLPYNLG
jgi:hypothetical protein